MRVFKNAHNQLNRANSPQARNALEDNQLE
jgi:hypothetical protein